MIRSEPNQSSSLPRSSRICSAPTPSTSSASPTKSTGPLRTGDSRSRSSPQAIVATIDPEREVDEKDPVPAQVLGQPAAGERAGDGRYHHGHGPQAQGEPAPVRRVDRREQRLRQRDHRRADDALHDARGQQHRKRERDPAQKRRERERGRGKHEHAHLAEAHREPARERQQDRLGHAIGRDHPGALSRAHRQIAGDADHRHVGDGQVQDVHERAHAQRHRGQDQLRAVHGLQMRRARRGRCGERRRRSSRGSGRSHALVIRRSATEHLQRDAATPRLERMIFAISASASRA